MSLMVAPWAQLTWSAVTSSVGMATAYAFSPSSVLRHSCCASVSCACVGTWMRPRNTHVLLAPTTFWCSCSHDAFTSLNRMRECSACSAPSSLTASDRSLRCDCAPWSAEKAFMRWKVPPMSVATASSSARSSSADVNVSTCRVPGSGRDSCTTFARAPTCSSTCMFVLVKWGTGSSPASAPAPSPAAPSEALVNTTDAELFSAP
mmetsp:Transcript_17578/g.59744  ORF Transcript_17578/g.59744 Transcript_17578/m.59744 type:complete len:205 (-) Transcript_17578:848-1462(-)